MRLSLTSKLYITGFLILCTIFGLLTLGYLSKQRFEITLETNKQISDIRILVLENRRREKDFFLRYDMKYNDAVEQQSRAILNHLYVLKQKDLKDKVVSLLEQVAVLVTTYLEQFKQVVALHITQGLNESTGLRAELREAIHHVERVLDTQQQAASLKAQMLMLRRREKDFIIRGDSKYIKKFKKDFDLFQELVKNSGVAEQDQQNLVTSSLAYRAAFLKFSGSHGQIQAKIKEFRTTVHKIDPMLQSALHGLESDQQHKLNQLNQRLLSFASLAILLIIVLLVMINRSCTKVLSSFKTLFSACAEGNFSERFPEQEIDILNLHNDDISFIAFNYNKLAQYIDNLQQQMQALSEQQFDAEVLERTLPDSLAKPVQDLQVTLKGLSLQLASERNQNHETLQLEDDKVLYRVLAENTAFMLRALSQRAIKLEFELLSGQILTKEQQQLRSDGFADLDIMLKGLGEQSKLLSHMLKRRNDLHLSQPQT